MATENEMTIPEMDELTAEELAAADPTGLATLLYVIRGLGADRDRSMNLAEFAKAIQKLYTLIYVKGAEGVETSVKPGEVVGYVGGARFLIKPSLLEVGSSLWGITADVNDLNYGNGTFEFNVDSDGVVFKNGNYKAVLNERSLKLYKNVNVVFELKDGVVEKLTYKAVGGIIDKSGASSISLNEIPEVLAVGHVPGAVVRLFVSANTKIYPYAGNSNYFKVGNSACVVEFVNFDASGNYSARNDHYLNPTAPNWNWQVD